MCGSFISPSSCLRCGFSSPGRLLQVALCSCTTCIKALLCVCEARAFVSFRPCRVFGRSLCGLVAKCHGRADSTWFKPCGGCATSTSPPQVIVTLLRVQSMIETQRSEPNINVEEQPYRLTPRPLPLPRPPSCLWHLHLRILGGEPSFLETCTQAS